MTWSLLEAKSDNKSEGWCAAGSRSLVDDSGKIFKWINLTKAFPVQYLQYAFLGWIKQMTDMNEPSLVCLQDTQCFGESEP